MEDEIMKSINAIKKIALATFLAFTFSLSTLVAQNDTMYVMKAGVVVKKYNVNTQVDSLIIYNPNKKVTINIDYVNIPAGTFIMGSPTTEVHRDTNERQHQVTLSAFRMSKYEITNAQYAAFLNAIGIGSNGWNTQYGQLISQTTGYDYLLYFTNNKWAPKAGYENYPVVCIHPDGAVQFAKYVGGKLPTEAQWEYACRAGTTTPFNTGNCLNNLQANYDWGHPYGCTNTVTTGSKIQPVGTYPANAWGLYDMHGNVMEYCSDNLAPYPTTPQTDPTGPISGRARVIRGGYFTASGEYCRSAFRYRYGEGDYSSNVLGFRVVMAP